MRPMVQTQKTDNETFDDHRQQCLSSAPTIQVKTSNTVTGNVALMLVKA